MSGSRFVALEKEDFSFIEGKPVGSKNASTFTMHFHFLASQGKLLSGAFCFSHFIKSFYYALNTSFYGYNKCVTE